MADSVHLWLAGFVFLMLLIGVTLTILEFRRGLRESEAPDNPDAAGPGSGGIGNRRREGPASGE